MSALMEEMVASAAVVMSGFGSLSSSFIRMGEAEWYGSRGQALPSSRPRSDSGSATYFVTLEKITSPSLHLSSLK